MPNPDNRVTRRNLGNGLSIPAAAERLGWPEWTLRRAIERGEVTVHKMAGMRRLLPDEIERLEQLLGPMVISDSDKWKFVAW